jgi:hypothetical protein
VESDDDFHIHVGDEAGERVPATQPGANASGGRPTWPGRRGAGREGEERPGQQCPLADPADVPAGWTSAFAGTALTALPRGAGWAGWRAATCCGTVSSWSWKSSPFGRSVAGHAGNVEQSRTPTRGRGRREGQPAMP